MKVHCIKNEIKLLYSYIYYTPTIFVQIQQTKCQTLDKIMSSLILIFFKLNFEFNLRTAKLEKIGEI